MPSWDYKFYELTKLPVILGPIKGSHLLVIPIKGLSLNKYDSISNSERLSQNIATFLSSSFI